MPLSDEFDRSELLNFLAVLGADKRGLVPIRLTNSECAIVFIHGFNTDSLKTWGYEGTTFWPYDLCKALNADGYCFQYLNAARDTEERAPLGHTEVAQKFLSELARISRRHRRIVLLTHSFGGIIAKRAIVEGLRGQPDHQEALRQLYGLYAISCPNWGHFFAMVSAIPFLMASRNLRLLWMANPTLRDLAVSFAGASPQLPNLRVRTMSENASLFGVFRVSERDARIENNQHDLSERNHSTICKSLTDAEPEFECFRTFVASRFDVADAYTLPL